MTTITYDQLENLNMNIDAYLEYLGADYAACSTSDQCWAIFASRAEFEAFARHNPTDRRITL